MTHGDVIAYYRMVYLGVTPLHAVELIEKSKQPMQNQAAIKQAAVAISESRQPENSNDI